MPAPRTTLLAALALAALPASASAAADGIRVQHERVTFGPHTSMVTVVTMPRPVGNRVLAPALPGGIVSEGTATVSAVSKSLARHGTAVAINADLFEYATGQPSGLLLIDGIVFNQPQGARPALQIDGDGTLSTTTPRARGQLTLPSRKVLPFEVNVGSDPDGTVFYDRGWGPSAPSGAGHSVLARLTAAQLDDRHQTWLGKGTMTVLRSSGGTLAIPPEQSPDKLFQASGTAARALTEMRPGQKLGVRYRLGPLAPDVAAAIGGGPVLIRDGRIVFSVKAASREFTSGQLVPPDARTAVAQRRDGSIIFYAADMGSGSTGLTISEVARDLKRRGAITAMSFDSGGSTSVAIDGRLLNQPSDGVERPVGNQLVYFVGDKRHRQPVVDVRASGAAPGSRVPALSFTTVRPVAVSVSLHDPDGRVYVVAEQKVGPGVHRIPVPGDVRLRPGRWQAIVTALEADTNVRASFTVARAQTPTASTPLDPMAARDAPSGTDLGHGTADVGVSPWIFVSLAVALALAAGLAVLLVRHARR